MQKPTLPDPNSLLPELEKQILTTSNISKDLEANICHLRQVIEKVGRGGDGNADRDEFAATLLQSRDVVQVVTNSTQRFATIIEETSLEMESVARAFKETAVTFAKLKQTGEDVSKFVTVIQVLADQTKLLALNARIEAARAGEHGRGFSVVADEVRSLSAESKQSSDEVFESIDGFTAILGKFETELSEQLIVFDKSQEKLSHAGDMAANVQTQIAKMVGALEQMEDILGSLEHLGDAEYSLEQAQISCENLNRYVARSLRLQNQLSKSTGDETGASCVSGRLMDELHAAITTENHTRSIGLIKDALSEGKPALQLMQLVSGVCERVMYEQKNRNITLSELYINGTILEDILHLLDPELRQDEASRKAISRGTIVLGNAYGDYHSLGRKMVGVLLQASGYEVIDLGMSVPNEKLIKTAIEHKARLIGISALLLHTASEVTKLRQQLDSQGLRDIKIIVGGAPFLIDEKLNETIGADFVAHSAAEGVDLANYVFGKDQSNE